MKWKRFWLIVSAFVLSLFVIVGIGACNERENMITASAETTATSSDYFDLRESSDASKNISTISNKIAIRYKLSRTNYQDSETGNLDDDCFASFMFDVQTANGESKMKVIATTVGSSTYLYLHENSLYGYTLRFTFLSGRSFEISMSTCGKTYKDPPSVTFGSGYNTNSYYYVNFLSNPRNQILPFDTENKITIDLYGDSLSNTESYKIVMDYAIFHRSPNLYKVFENPDGWIWWEELWENYTEEYQYYGISTNVDFSVMDDGSELDFIDESRCVYFGKPHETAARSLKGVCVEVFDQNKAQSVFGSEDTELYKKAYAIAYSQVTRYVTVQYLKDIPFTPFAMMHEEKNVELTFLETDLTVDIDTVEAGFAKKDLTFPRTACNSAIDYFEVNDGYFTAKYLSSMYVGLKTEDGYTQYSTLDCNKSFDEFYAPISDTLGAIFDEGSEFLEVVLNRIIVEQYPVLVDSYEINAGDKLYGLWGWGVIPESQSFNLNDLFFADTELKTENMLKCYQLKGELVNQQYKDLLEEYGYGSFYQSINGAADWFKDDTNCTYLIYFCDGETESAVGSENGSTDINDEDSAWENGFQETLSNIGDWLKKIFSGEGLTPEEIERYLKMAGGALLSVGGVVCFVLFLKKR